MIKKIETMFALGIGNAIWKIEFTKNPYECFEKLGSLEEVKSRILRALEIKYEE